MPDDREESLTDQLMRCWDQKDLPRTGPEKPCLPCDGTACLEAGTCRHVDWFAGETKKALKAMGVVDCWEDLACCRGYDHAKVLRLAGYDEK